MHYMLFTFSIAPPRRTESTAFLSFPREIFAHVLLLMFCRFWFCAGCNLARKFVALLHLLCQGYRNAKVMVECGMLSAKMETSGRDSLLYRIQHITAMLNFGILPMTNWWRYDAHSKRRQKHISEGLEKSETHPEVWSRYGTRWEWFRKEISALSHLQLSLPAR